MSRERESTWIVTECTLTHPAGLKALVESCCGRWSYTAEVGFFSAKESSLAGAILRLNRLLEDNPRKYAECTVAEASTAIRAAMASDLGDWVMEATRLENRDIGVSVTRRGKFWEVDIDPIPCRAVNPGAALASVFSKVVRGNKAQTAIAMHKLLGERSDWANAASEWKYFGMNRLVHTVASDMPPKHADKYQE